MNTQFKGELHLPKDLTVLQDEVFSGCDFSGNLILPPHLRMIGQNVFANCWRLIGTLTIPNEIVSIGRNAFAECRSLEGLVLPNSIESIHPYAFSMCTGFQKIVCNSDLPAHLYDNVFNGVPKDNFTVEVPESAVQLYKTTVGWSDFKRISAHRELICLPSTANAISSATTRRLKVDAEGDWVVSSIPSWCTLSSNSGSGKEELILTIDAIPAGSMKSRSGEIVFKLKNKDYTSNCTVSQFPYEYKEDEVITLQKATMGNTGGINLVFLGDGYSAEDIARGDYIRNVKMQVENFFAIEPYTTYRNYFNVYTAIPVSSESGIGTLNTIRYAKFGTTFTDGVGLRCNYEDVFEYVLNMKTSVNKENLNQSLIIIIPNSTDYGGICQLWEDGSAIAFCPLSTYAYPLDTRGVIQHEAGGHGFGKLGDEYIYHNAFIDFCRCTCCEHVFEFNYAKSLGWYENLSLSGKMHEVPWSHFIYDNRYKDIVDIFEGGFKHTRGVFRSEQNSCMNNNIPYYSTISREAIVKRIKKYAGEPYSLEEFIEKDKRTNIHSTRSIDSPFLRSNVQSLHFSPRIKKGAPLNK